MTNEEISLRTKQKLSSALKEVMEKKPLSKITITELISECGVNRKTFYYHFRNIYDLLRWTVDREAINIVKNFDFISDAESALRFVMDYTEQNKHIINCALDSMGRDELKHFFYTDLVSVVYKIIDCVEQDLGIKSESEFKDFLAGFYTEAVAGIMIDWSRNRTTQDKGTILRNIMTVFQISIPAVLKSQNAAV